MKSKIPREHPRYFSLVQREALVEGYEKGATALQGLIAQGRGEAFDYLIGERTTENAKKAINAAAALLLSKKSTISVNGNTAVLCPKEIVELAKITGAKIEINLFHRTEKRAVAIEKILKKHGAKEVLGIKPEKEIALLKSERRKVSEKGILSSEAVLVPLEDGDRTEALAKLGKKVIAIDLNPLSRTAQKASITIVDNITRALPLLISEAKKLKKLKKKNLEKILKRFNNDKNLKEALKAMLKRLEKLSELPNDKR